MKIIISGPAGVGKTTLARELSNKLGIPFISSSSKQLWPKYNIRSHRDLLLNGIEDPGFNLIFQKDLLKTRNRLLKNADSFVTDRGPLDNLVYFLLQTSAYTTKAETSKFIKHCALIQKAHCTHQIFLNYPKNSEVPKDNMRINNIYYQELVGDIMWLNIVRDTIGTRSLQIEYGLKNNCTNGNLICTTNLSYRERNDEIIKYLSRCQEKTKKSNS